MEKYQEGNVLFFSLVLSFSPRNKNWKLNCVSLLSLSLSVKQISKTNSKHNIQYLFILCLPVWFCVQQNHFSLSKNRCLEHINQANRKSLSDDFSMFPASPTSSPNLSVKKSILAHKSLIQWSFPVKRVKCYLIECAVSYQRETARPALTIHITQVTCIQVHVNRGWKNLRYFWSIFGFIGFSDLL